MGRGRTTAKRQRARVLVRRRARLSFPSSPYRRERSAVRRTVKVSAPLPKDVRSLSARAACYGEPCCEQGPSRTRPTALHGDFGPWDRASGRDRDSKKSHRSGGFPAFTSLPSSHQRQPHLVGADGDPWLPRGWLARHIRRRRTSRRPGVTPVPVAPPTERLMMAPPDEQGVYSLSELSRKSRKSRAVPHGLCITGMGAVWAPAFLRRPAKREQSPAPFSICDVRPLTRSGPPRAPAWCRPCRSPR